MATKSFLTYFNEQCIYRISVVKNILILKRLKGLLFPYVKLSIFFTDCWTANAYLTFSWTKAKLWREAICDVVSHISFTFWKAFEQCRLNTFLCYAMLLATAFTNFHHAITTRFKCTSCAVDLSNERQLASEATPSSVDFLFSLSSKPFIAFQWRKILYTSKKWAKLTFVNWMLECTESHS